MSAPTVQGADLARCEALLHETLRVEGDPVLTAVADHLPSAGGKRLRPRLALLAAGFGDPERPHVVPAAVAVELLHVASLYHDDVIDAANLRRGLTTANVRWSNTVAILAGDFLMARAVHLVAPLGGSALPELALTVQRLVQGQLGDALGAGSADPEEHYRRVVADKTAALFTLSVRLGATAGAVPTQYLAPLVDYAEALGSAFQLADDLRDLTEPAERSGKSAGVDVRTGVRTLPVLRALRRRGTRRLRRALEAGAAGDRAAHRLALDLLRSSPGAAECRAEVVAGVDRARAALAALPDRPARAELDDLARQVARSVEPSPRATFAVT